MNFAMQMIDAFFLVYKVMLFVRILASWFPEFQRSPWMMFLAFCTDPYLNFFRRLLPPLGPLDLSPIIAFFCLQFLQYGFKLLIITLFR